MKLWVSKNSDVPIQEQLVTQLILGIVSADRRRDEQRHKQEGRHDDCAAARMPAGGRGKDFACPGELHE